MTRMALFLDDVRMPADVFNYTQDIEYLQMDWIIVRNHDEFIKAIESMYSEKWRLPSLISFDHDLAKEHTQYFFDNGGHENPPSLSDVNFTEKTGMDCAKWLIAFCTDKNIPLPAYKVHSKNPPGKQNITSILDNFKKFQAGFYD